MGALSAVRFLVVVIAIGYIVEGVVCKAMERHLQSKCGLAPAN